VSEPLRAALGFVEALSLDPDRAEVDSLRAAGLTDADIEVAATICSAFHIIVRIADSLDFHVPTEEEFARHAPRMAARDYA